MMLMRRSMPERPGAARRVLDEAAAVEREIALPAREADRAGDRRAVDQHRAGVAVSVALGRGPGLDHEGDGGAGAADAAAAERTLATGMERRPALDLADMAQPGGTDRPGLLLRRCQQGNRLGPAQAAAGAALEGGGDLACLGAGAAVELGHQLAHAAVPGRLEQIEERLAVVPVWRRATPIDLAAPGELGSAPRPRQRIGAAQSFAELDLDPGAGRAGAGLDRGQRIAVVLRPEIEPAPAGLQDQPAARGEHRAGHDPQPVAQRAAGRQPQQLGRHQWPADREQPGDVGGIACDPRSVVLDVPAAVLELPDAHRAAGIERVVRQLLQHQLWQQVDGHAGLLAQGRERAEQRPVLALECKFRRFRARRSACRDARSIWRILQSGARADADGSALIAELPDQAALGGEQRIDGLRRQVWCAPLGRRITASLAVRAASGSPCSRSTSPMPWIRPHGARRWQPNSSQSGQPSAAACAAQSSRNRSASTISCCQACAG